MSIIHTWQTKLKSTWRKEPQQVFFVAGMASVFLALWAGILWWGFSPAAAPGQRFGIESLLQPARHKPVRMPFRERGGLPSPSTDGSYQMQSVMFDRG